MLPCIRRILEGKCRSNQKRRRNIGTRHNRGSCVGTKVKSFTSVPATDSAEILG
jgi:hypothetical protein